MSGIKVTANQDPRASASTDSFVPKTAVIAGSRPRLSAETQALLRTRLWAAALMLVVAFSLFFVRGLLLPRRDGVLALLHVVVLVVLGLSLALLSSRRPIALVWLRGMEVAIFALVVGFFAVAEYRLILQHVIEDDPTLAVATMKSSILYLFATMAMYGVFIPNHWRRAALVVVPMALTPTLVMLVLRVVHPELVEFSRRVASYEQISENVLMMILGAASSIFGTHVINTLRAQAFEARELGQYRLGERIGEGGMGEVYFAEHQLLKRPCAIKLIRPGSADDPKALARFEREVRATAQLSHWNTVEIYDYGRTEDGTFYYVMEYLPGLSFGQLVERHGPLPPERVIHLIRQACQALREAHGQGLIHRDLKPANILSAHRGGLYDVTKLLDFGLVKPTAKLPAPPLSQEGSIIGSPLYMSPEQVGGSGNPDRRSDLYALGAVTYYLLTGRPPFQGETALGVMIAHARDPVVPPSQLQPGVPADLERVVLRCLAKDPAARYPDAEALERALAACAAADGWSQQQAAHWWRSIRQTPWPAPALWQETGELSA